MENPMTTEKTAPKTASITLRANGSTMRLLATRKPDETAVTLVTITDAEKRTTRGMTEPHASMAVATTAIATLATKAEKLGWTRALAGRGFVAKPDAFTTLPAAPKP